MLKFFSDIVILIKYGICFIIINLKIFMCNFFGDFNNSSYNYVEFTSWVSASILALQGLLTIFLSTHYQNNVLCAKQLLWSLRVEEVTLQKFKSNLLQYEYLTEHGMNTFRKSLKIFKYTSIAIVIMWTLSAFAYLIRVTSFGGKILVLGSVVLLGIMLYFINKMLEKISSDKEICSISNLLDMAQFNDLYEKELIFGDILKALYEIKIYKSINKVQIKLITPLPIHNYSIVLHIRNNHFYADAIYKCSKKENVELKATSFECTSLDQNLHRKLFENLNSTSSYSIYLKNNSLEAEWYNYDAVISSIEENIEYKLIHISMEGKNIINRIPVNLVNAVDRTQLDSLLYEVSR